MRTAGYACIADDAYPVDATGTSKFACQFSSRKLTKLSSMKCICNLCKREEENIYFLFKYKK